MDHDGAVNGIRQKVIQLPTHSLEGGSGCLAFLNQDNFSSDEECSLFKYPNMSID